jgi:hypothetical protein
MGNLRVDPDYLGQLASKQDAAGAAISNAGLKAAGIAESVSETHGEVCGLSRDALSNAEHTLADLVASMRAISDALAGKLRSAKDIYHQTDRRAF